MAQKKSPGGTKKTTKKTTAPAKKTAQAPKPIRREVGAAVCLMLGMISFLEYFKVNAWLVNGFSKVIKGLFGWGFLAVPVCFFWAAWILFFHKGRPISWRLLCVSLIPLNFGAIVHLIAYDEPYVYDVVGVQNMFWTGVEMKSGGVISSAIADLLRGALSVYGALPLLLVLISALILCGARVSLKKAVEDIKAHEYPPYEPEPEPDPEQFEPLPTRSLRAPARPSLREDIDIPIDADEKKPGKRAKPASDKNRRSSWIDIPIDDIPEEEKPKTSVRRSDDIPDMPTGIIYRGRNTAPDTAKKRDPRRDPIGVEAIKIPDIGDVFPIPVPEKETVPVVLDEGSAEITPVPEPAAQPVKEKLDKNEVNAAAAEITQAIQEAEELPAYVYPPVDLLKAGKSLTSDGREEVALNRERLETTLRSFGIGASVCDITRGPTVTRYDLELDAGVKLNKLTNLAGDLALSLGVVNVRIAPIPDKISTVGVEVPNKIVSTVYLREIIDSPAFRNASSKLSFAVGKDIGGNCIVGNISKMPHMLIAGTTGSGKSVCMNSLILSLLYKATPDEVRLIMIDPKMVELGIYNGIPHLYIPVVTDPKKAAGALQWSVVEMMKRYRMFSEIGVRDINGYNNYMSKSEQPTLPNVVIVIDELADLMMTAAKEVEESICRVAQMGRAAGMHLVIATQRPSADVITGLMKANIPSRIAFAVSSALESRIILDNQGAEKLVGMGDMLYAPLGCGKPLRVQGAFVSDEEREEVINFIKEGAAADYDDDIMRQIEKAAAGKDSASDENDSEDAAPGANPFSDYDELLPQAVDVILDTKQASVSMLQRRLKLGYSRAARLVDQMEELGIVGPFEGSKPRQLLITREQWQEMSMTGNTAVEQLINQQKDDFSGSCAQ
jgi:S-DNA-T family DNA segregation ATPase FtsK/SpoIIIE